ncbi:MAG: FtsH protease activity modulator HflK [Burkholderiales bacterium]|nr:FtsH protease activity modulator HflK [Burkholderiales bacterium]
MAWNDPNWGKKNNSSGPPDLDELWRRFNERVSGLFGGKGRGPNLPTGGNNPVNRANGALLLAGIILVIWIGSGFYIVNPRESGVVLRFGKAAEITLPGPRWHLPYPIESVEIVDTAQVRVTEVGYRQNDKTKQQHEAAMLTKDKNIINVQFAVQYSVTDPKNFLFKNRVGEDAIFVRQVAESAMREIVGKTIVDDVLSKSTEVANQAGKLMQSMFDLYEVGVTVANVTINQVQPPEQVQDAFNDAIKADQDRERQKNEGEAYLKDIVPKAEGAKQRLLQEAEGYKQSLIARAEGDASRFKSLVGEYNKAPGVTRDRLYIDAMQQIYSSTTKVLVDQKGGNNLLYLPLDKLMQRVQEGQVAAPAKSTTGETPRPNEADQGRDALRNREGR